MHQTLNSIADNQHAFCCSLLLNDGIEVVLRPLRPTDTATLARFLSDLSPTTRKYYILDSFDEATAKQLCEDIGKYDKLRFVVLMNNEIVGLFEFSMDLVQADIDRYMEYGIPLENGLVCRFGPCLADKVQGTGLASAIFPSLVDIAKQLGQKRMILWGGVFAENAKAIRYYEKIGFTEVGRFKNSDGVGCVDMTRTL